jgi:hypothetical protein
MYPINQALIKLTTQKPEITLLERKQEIIVNRYMFTSLSPIPFL